MNHIQSLFKELRKREVRVWLEGEKLRFNGPKGSLTPELREDLVQMKSEIIEFLRSTEQLSSDAVAMVAMEREAKLPVSFAQQRLLLLHQMEGPSARYNIPSVLRLSGKLNIEAVEKSIDSLVSRHDSLRTSFVQEGMTFYSKIGEEQKIPVATMNLSYFSEDEREAELERVLAQENQKVFDIFDPILFRANLIVISDEDHVLMLTTHHAISDGWSLGIMTRDFVEFYNATVNDREARLPEFSIQYVDYAQWQKKRMEQEDISQLKSYWEKQLSGLPELLELPTDYPRPAEQAYRGKTKVFYLKPSLYETLQTFSRRNQVTLYMVLLAAFKVLLSRYSEQSDIAVGTTMANRKRKEVENLIGYFMNMVVLRSSLEGTKSFEDLLLEIKDTVLNADHHQDLPFEQVVEQLKPKRSLSYSPLFQVMMIHNSFPVKEEEMEGIKISSITPKSEVSKYDITLTFTEQNQEIQGGFEYNTELFADDTIDRMIDHLQYILESVCANKKLALKNISLLTLDEQNTLVKQWNNTKTDFESHLCIHQAFEKQVQLTPNDIALVFDEDKLSYQELNDRAEKLAVQLQAMGVGPDVKVGVSLERSIDMVVGLYGVLKSGGAYVPLDPAYPISRLSLIAEDAELRCIITHSNIEAIFFDNSIPKLRIDRDFDFNSAAAIRENSDVCEQNIAYMIYTSGTTGRPKGVMVTHRNAANFFKGLDENVGLGAQSKSRPVWLSVTSISFDISVLELFWTLSRGMKVVLQPDLPQTGNNQVQSWKRQTESAKFSYSGVSSPKFSLFYFASDEETCDHKYKLLTEGAKYCDQNGFDSVWVPERHFHSFGGQYPNPSVVASAVAAITDSINIRAGSVVAPLHNPIRIAEEWSMVDNLSNGRVGVAFASGWHFNDFVFFPENFNERHAVLREHVDKVQRLWKGETLKFTGGNGNDVDVMIRPRPVQPELPVWITTAGNPETYRYAGSIGANILTHMLGQHLTDLKNNITTYREALAENGFDPEKGQVTLMVHTFIGDDVETVKGIVKEPFKKYLKNSVGLLKPIAQSEGLDVNVDEEALIEAGFHRYFDSAALFGTTESCMPMVQSMYQAGVDELACLIDFGVDETLTLGGLHKLNQLKQLAAAQVAQYNLKTTGRLVSPLSLIKEHKVDHLQCTPSFAKMIMNYPDGHDSCKHIKKLLLGGEAVPASVVKAYTDALSEREIFNMYGPTETTVWSGVRKISPNDVRIGGPLANTKLLVLDAELSLAPIGVPGELFITGEGVTRGYWNRPGLSADRFLPDPWGEPGSRMYKTGDRVKYCADGCIEFLGRSDFQVKFKGFRIEIGDIEHQILSIEGVGEVVVSIFKPEIGDEKLVAYVVPKDELAKPALTSGGIQLKLRDKLPEYMVPKDYMFMERLPLTPNGKIDRKSLPLYKSSKASQFKPVSTSPKNELEIKILEVWKHLLQKQEIGIYDNFFEIGGNSLLIAHMKIELESLVHAEVSVIDIFKNPTIESMSRYFGNSGKNSQSISNAKKRAETRRLRMRKRVKEDNREEAIP